MRVPQHRANGLIRASHQCHTHRTPQPRISRPRLDLAEFDNEYSCLVILNSLNPPRLRALDLSCPFPLPEASFVSLKRAPGIQTFTARFDGREDRIEDGTNIAHSIFGAMPSLTKLGLHLDTEELFFQILPLLNKSPTFLPHL